MEGPPKDLRGLLHALFGWMLPDPSTRVAPEEAHRLLRSPHPPQLLDVRTKEEYRLGRIPGSRNIPLDELDRRWKEIDRFRPVLLYCRSGMRSSRALSLLRSRGLDQAVHIPGGILAWQGRGLPLEP